MLSLERGPAHVTPSKYLPWQILIALEDLRDRLSFTPKTWSNRESILESLSTLHGTKIHAERKSCTRYYSHVPSTYHYTYRVWYRTAIFAISYTKKLHCAKKPSRIKQIISFGMAPCIFLVLLQQLLQETNPNPPICKLDRKSTTQTGIWFRTEWFAVLKTHFRQKQAFCQTLEGKEKISALLSECSYKPGWQNSLALMPAEKYTASCPSQAQPNLSLSCPVYLLLLYSKDKFLSTHSLEFKVAESMRGDRQLPGTGMLLHEFLYSIIMK